MTSSLASVVGDKRTSSKRTRFEVAQGSGRGLQLGESLVLEGRKDSEVFKEKGMGEISLAKEDGSVSKETLFPSAAGEETIGKCTLLRFHARSGWLSKSPGPTALVATLGAFELGPDKKIWFPRELRR